MLAHPHQKSLYQFEGNFHANLHAKNQLHSTSFLRYFKEKANLLFWVILACLTTHTWNNSINLKKSLMRIYRQKVGFILHVFLEILQTCYLGCFLNGRLCTLKVILSICRKFWYLFVGKKSNSFPTFLGLMQGYVNFLFWVLWAWLATHTQNDSINL